MLSLSLSVPWALSVLLSLRLRALVDVIRAADLRLSPAVSPVVLDVVCGGSLFSGSWPRRCAGLFCGPCLLSLEISVQVCSLDCVLLPVLWTFSGSCGFLSVPCRSSLCSCLLCGPCLLPALLSLEAVSGPLCALAWPVDLLLSAGQVLGVVQVCRRGACGCDLCSGLLSAVRMRRFCLARVLLILPGPLCVLDVHVCGCALDCVL